MSDATPQQKSIITNGVRLNYFDWGTEGKPPMVCIHGHTGQAHMWDEFAAAMAPHYHVYAIDQRGHGQSQWASDGYSRDQFVADMGAFIDALGLSKVVIVGHSMGGWNAMLYAPDHPDRVERVVLVDIAPEPSEETRQQWLIRPPTPLDFDSFDDAVAWGRTNDLWATDARLRQDMADRLRQRDDGKWVWVADLALFNQTMPDQRDEAMIARYWRCLAAIACPVLLVRGRGSILISDDIVARMRQANPRLSAIDVADAGHVVPLDKPLEFIVAVGAFLGLPV